MKPSVALYHIAHIVHIAHIAHIARVNCVTSLGRDKSYKNRIGAATYHVSGYAPMMIQYYNSMCVE